MNKVIAVVGMCGSGKSVLCDYLESNGFKKLYFGGITYTKMAEAGIERTPDSEREFREKLRRDYGKECYAKLLLPDILDSLENSNVVLDGLYSWYEYTFLRDKLGDNFKLICIVADKGIRYDRIAKRPDRPFDRNKAIERDISEIENLYKGGPIAYADYYILNNGTIDDCINRAREILENI